MDTYGLLADLPDYDGDTWPLDAWRDDDSQLDSIRPDWDPNRLNTTEALAAAQTWREVLDVPTAPRDDASFVHPMASGAWPARTSVRVSERPDRGAVKVTTADGKVTYLAADGSPMTPDGKSSKRAGAMARAALRRGEVLANDGTAEVCAEVLAEDAGYAVPRPIMVDGEVVGWFDGGPIG